MSGAKFQSIRFAVLTISDSRGLEDDKSGDLLAKRIEAAGHTLSVRDLCTDDKAKIVAKLQEWVKNDGVDAIITTGGTGLTGRDVTVEAHKEIYEKEITAFATLFALISWQKIGTSAVQSRSCAGVANGTFLFALPGSPSACRDGWDEILKPQFDQAHKPCNFVEIIPRLAENGSAP